MSLITLTVIEVGSIVLFLIIAAPPSHLLIKHLQTAKYPRPQAFLLRHCHFYYYLNLIQYRISKQDKELLKTQIFSVKIIVLFYRMAFWKGNYLVNKILRMYFQEILF